MHSKQNSNPSGACQCCNIKKAARKACAEHQPQCALETVLLYKQKRKKNANSSKKKAFCIYNTKDRRKELHQCKINEGCSYYSNNRIKNKKFKLKKIINKPSRLCLQTRRCFLSIKTCININIPESIGAAIYLNRVVAFRFFIRRERHLRFYRKCFQKFKEK